MTKQTAPRKKNRWHKLQGSEREASFDEAGRNVPFIKKSNSGRN